MGRVLKHELLWTASVEMEAASRPPWKANHNTSSMCLHDWQSSELRMSEHKKTALDNTPWDCRCEHPVRRLMPFAP